MKENRTKLMQELGKEHKKHTGANPQSRDDIKRRISTVVALVMILSLTLGLFSIGAISRAQSGSAMSDGSGDISSDKDVGMDTDVQTGIDGDSIDGDVSADAAEADLPADENGTPALPESGEGTTGGDASGADDANQNTEADPADDAAEGDASDAAESGNPNGDSDVADDGGAANDDATGGSSANDNTTNGSDVSDADDAENGDSNAADADLANSNATGNGTSYKDADATGSDAGISNNSTETFADINSNNNNGADASNDTGNDGVITNSGEATELTAAGDDATAAAANDAATSAPAYNEAVLNGHVRGVYNRVTRRIDWVAEINNGSTRVDFGRGEVPISDTWCSGLELERETFCVLKDGVELSEDEYTLTIKTDEAGTYQRGFDLTLYDIGDSIIQIIYSTVRVNTLSAIYTNTIAVGSSATPEY